jgi:hypothetical protein
MSALFYTDLLYTLHIYGWIFRGYKVEVDLVARSLRPSHHLQFSRMAKDGFERELSLRLEQLVIEELCNQLGHAVFRQRRFRPDLIPFPDHASFEHHSCKCLIQQAGPFGENEELIRTEI